MNLEVNKAFIGRNDYQPTIATTPFLAQSRQTATTSNCLKKEKTFQQHTLGDLST
jgi:hypothetical protein